MSRYQVNVFDTKTVAQRTRFTISRPFLITQQPFILTFTKLEVENIHNCRSPENTHTHLQCMRETSKRLLLNPNGCHGSPGVRYGRTNEETGPHIAGHGSRHEHRGHRLTHKQIRNYMQKYTFCYNHIIIIIAGNTELST